MGECKANQIRRNSPFLLGNSDFFRPFGSFFGGFDHLLTKAWAFRPAHFGDSDGNARLNISLLPGRGSRHAPHQRFPKAIFLLLGASIRIPALSAPSPEGCGFRCRCRADVRTMKSLTFEALSRPGVILYFCGISTRGGQNHSQDGHTRPAGKTKLPAGNSSFTLPGGAGLGAQYL